MKDNNNPLGGIFVSPRAIATIAYQAALESYGVVGLAHKNLVNGLSQVIVKDPTHGIEVEYEGDEIVINIYIIIEYGMRISSVASSVMNLVHFQVEKALDLPVKAVNVHVQGLRVSEIE